MALWILYHPIHTSYRAVVLDWCGRLEEEPAVGRREQAKLQEMKGIPFLWGHCAQVKLVNCGKYILVSWLSTSGRVLTISPSLCLSPAELSSLLRSPVLPRTLSRTYPTRGGNHKLLAKLHKHADHSTAPNSSWNLTL